MSYFFLPSCTPLSQTAPISILPLPPPFQAWRHLWTAQILYSCTLYSCHVWRKNSDIFSLFSLRTETNLFYLISTSAVWHRLLSSKPYSSMDVYSWIYLTVNWCKGPLPLITLSVYHTYKIKSLISLLSYV